MDSIIIKKLEKWLKVNDDLQLATDAHGRLYIHNMNKIGRYKQRKEAKDKN